MTVDGVGEWTTAANGLGLDTEIKLDQEIKFPHSLGLLYSAFTAFLGFEVNEGEYKVMGMAPYGEPGYLERIFDKLVRVAHDGSFHLNMDYFSYHYSPDKTFNSRFTDLFGEPRDHKSHFFTRTSGYPIYFGEKPSNYQELFDIPQIERHYPARYMLLVLPIRVFVTPIALGVKLFSDPLRMKKSNQGSWWISREAKEDSIEGAEKQF